MSFYPLPFAHPVVRPRIFRRPVVGYPVYSGYGGIGGAGNDIISINNGGTGPAGPPGPPGPPGNPSPVAVTDVVGPTYTALSTDYFLCVLTNGLVTVTLPTGTLGKVYIVKDCFGNAVTNPITIQGTGGQLVDGGTAIINTNFGSLQFVFNGVDWSIV
jgi:hypothetical protein